MRTYSVLCLCLRDCLMFERVLCAGERETSSVRRRRTNVLMLLLCTITKCARIAIKYREREPGARISLVHIISERAASVCVTRCVGIMFM